MTGKFSVSALARAIAAAGTEDHIPRLIDFAASLAAHDYITVVRYSAIERPAFIAHRNYSDAMVRRYLDVYYPHDPFHAHWRERRKPGVVALGQWRDAAFKRGKYIAEFLKQSTISDELGVLLDEGGGRCLGIFLDRRRARFTKGEIARLSTAFPVLAALHARHIGMHGPQVKVIALVPGEPTATGKRPRLAASLWPQLTQRECQLVDLILAGHPSAGIARRLAISPGTVKNHRRRIYDKLDITTERELFLQYIDSGGA